MNGFTFIKASCPIKKECDDETFIVKARLCLANL